MKLLEVLLHTIRGSAGVYLSDDAVWNMVQICYKISSWSKGSDLLRSMASNTLAHIILSMFSRIQDIVATTDDHNPTVITGSKHSTSSFSSSPSSSHDIASIIPSSSSTSVTPSTVNSDTSFGNNSTTSSDILASKVTVLRSSSATGARGIGLTSMKHQPYGVMVLQKVLHFLAGLTDPSIHEEADRILALSLINIVLETSGEALSRLPSLVSVLQDDLCKYLLQNSQTVSFCFVWLHLCVFAYGIVLV